MNIAWLNRPWLLRVARIVGYVAFGIAAFLVSLVLTFPTTRLKLFIEDRLSSPTMKVRIEDLSMRGLGAVALDGVGVTLIPPKPARIGGDEPPPVSPPREMRLDRLNVSIGLFRLLGGNLSVTATAKNGDGELGPITVQSDKEKIHATLEGIDQFMLPEEGAPLFGVRLVGKLVSGKGTLTYDRKDGWGASVGRLDLVADGMRIPSPTLSIDKHGGTITLSDIDLGKVTLALALDKKSNISELKSERRSGGADATVLHIEKAEVDGQDAKAVIEGHSHVRLFSGKSIKDGQMNVELAFAVSESFFERKVMVGTEEQSPNRLLSLALSADQRWKAAQSDNYWGVLCSGALGSPKCDPKKSTVRGKDFKPPPKEAEARSSGTHANPRADHRPAPAPAPAAPAPTPSAPPAAEQPHSPPEGSTAAGAREPAPAAAETPAAAAPTSITPTVIGRRLRNRDMEPEPKNEAMPGTGEAPGEELELDPEED